MYEAKTKLAYITNSENKSKRINNFEPLATYTRAIWK
jgi:hypothetical protein